LNACRNADPPWIGQTFQPSSNIHAVTENIAVLDSDIAHIDAYPKFDAVLDVDAGFTLSHGGLNLGRTLEGINDTGELNQQTVPGGFDDTSVMLNDGRVYDSGSDRPQPVQSSLLVGTD